jgi:hypothetical protein
MPDTAANTVFFLNEKSGNSSVKTLAAFDATTFVPTWSADIPLGAPAGTVRSFLRWGATGVAFLTDDAVIIAEYTGLPASKTLRITKAGTGSGTVTAPVGIDCGPTCTAQVPPNLTVTFVAIPAGRSVFAGWSGDADCKDGVVTMSVAVNCTATFSSNPIAFSDDPLTARSTRVKAAHITELRQGIDQLRARYNLGAFGWTDATIVPGVTTMKAVHLVELRTALSEVYAAAGRETPYFAVSLVPGLTISAAHIQELRAAVGGIW